MADYQRRVRLTLTEAEADALDTAIVDSQNHAWEVPAREVAALERARVKLDTARQVASARNAEKAARKLAGADAARKAGE